MVILLNVELIIKNIKYEIKASDYSRFVILSLA